VRPYNALNGLELKQVILKQIETHLDATGEFMAGVTFPCVDISWNVSLKVYPKENPHIEAHGEISEKVEGFNPRNRKPVELELAQNTLGIGAQVVGDPAKENVELRPGVSPDTMRTEAGLPVLKPELTKAAGMVEK